MTKYFVDDLTGKPLGGRYEVTKLIVMGSTASIYEGTMGTTFRRPIIIEALDPTHRRDAMRVERFRAEGFALG